MIELKDHPEDAGGEVAAYLARSKASGACLEHDPRWLTVLRDALGHRPYLLTARADEANSGELSGCLPLCLVRSPLFGRFLVSLPYLNLAGVVADDQQTANELIGHAVELTGHLKVRYLELRHRGPVDHRALPVSRDDKPLMLLDLPNDDTALWKSLSAKVRNQVRKGESNGLMIRWGGHDLLGDFYRIFSVNMRDLGTPVYPRALFECILRQFRREAELAVVELQGRAVAAALVLHDWAGRRTHVPSASSLRQFNSSNANMWMYHQLLLRAIERGSTQFDFGRSSIDSGTYRFKKQWGARPQPTVWQYHVRRGDINAVRPDSPRYQRRIAAWRKLPVWMTKVIGPPIVRGIP